MQQCLASFVATHNGYHFSGIAHITYIDGADPEIAAMQAVSDAYGCPMDDVTLVVLDEGESDE